MAGKAYLVGAGPGAADLLTLRAVRALATCDLVLVDDLVGEGVLEHVGAQARVVRVGKRCGGPSVPQSVTTRILVAAALRGETVVRLKGGDPYLFGRGGEEAEALAEAGVPFEVVPGITAALAAAATSGIPLTHRRLASSVAFASGHGADERPVALDVSAHTLVLYMCQRTLPELAKQLLESGRLPTTPVALVLGATWAGQSVYIGTLAEAAALAGRYAAPDAATPGLAIVGEVVSLAGTLYRLPRPALPLGALGHPSAQVSSCA